MGNIKTYELMFGKEEKSRNNISRTRVIKTLSGEAPDRIPIYDNFWPETENLYRERLNLSQAILLEDYFGIDVIILAPDESPFLSKARTVQDNGYEKIIIDGWGRKRRIVEGGYFGETLESPVKSHADLDNLVFEPANDIRRFQDKFLNAEFLNERFACFAKTGGPFIRTSFLREEEQWLIDMVSDPVFASELANRVTDFQIEVGLEALRRAACHDCGIWIFDDMGSNQGPVFSPETFREIFMPLYVRMVKRFKGAGARFVILHSDGNIIPFLEMLIEAGIDGINPVEPKAGMDLTELKKRFGSKLSFIGGMCNSFVLPSGKKSLVREKVAKIVNAGREGRVIIGAHSIGPDIPLENYRYYRELIQKTGMVVKL